jgi:hypothetical protein
MATQVLVIWTYAHSDQTGFLLQRSTDSASTWPVNYTTNASTMQYTDSDVVVGGTYWYHVAATNQFGTGSFSSTASIFLTTPGPVTLSLIPTPDTRPYDGTISSSQIPTLVSGSVVAGDTASFLQFFDTKHVGSGKTITPTASLIVTSGTPYLIEVLPDVVGQIDPFGLDVLGTIDIKGFDGTNSSSAIPVFVQELLPGDITSSIPTQSFSTPMVGVDILMNPDPLTIIIDDGNSGSNYTVNPNGQPVGIITGPSTSSINTASYVLIPTDTDLPFDSGWFVTINDATSGSSGFLTLDSLQIEGFTMALTSLNGSNWIGVGTASIRSNTLLYANGRYVGLNVPGNATDAQYSDDGGATWVPTTIPTSQFIWDGLYDGTLFVACGNNGTIITSSNGANWGLSSTGVTDQAFRIIYHAGRYVVVGVSSPGGFPSTSTGTIYTSTDLITWVAVSSSIPTTNAYLGVTYSPSLNMYLAVGEQGMMATSSNGVNWGDCSQPSPIYGTSLSSVAWNSTDMYFAACDFGGYIYNSPDGINWTLNTINPHIQYDGNYYTYVQRIDYDDSINKFLVFGTAPPS